MKLDDLVTGKRLVDIKTGRIVTVINYPSHLWVNPYGMVDVRFEDDTIGSLSIKRLETKDGIDRDNRNA